VSEDAFEILLTTREDKYTFLSCGETYIDPLNYLALFMPFTKLAWALIFITIFGWPLVLSLIENDFKFKNVLKDFGALFIGWAMILEQSHLRATNYQGKNPLYCNCGCVLLAIFILSNAYKGDCIRTLTKSFEVVPLTRIDQINKVGYNKYSIEYCIDSLSGVFDENELCSDEFYAGALGRKSQYTDQQLKLWKPVGFTSINESTEVKVDFFGKCQQKKALIGWRSVLEPLEKQLQNQKQFKSQVYLGQEHIFTRRIGWRLKRYGSPKVLKRMWTIVESGIHQKLINMSYTAATGTVFEPRPIKIHGNISVQFVFHSFGLLVALMVFTLELHEKIFLAAQSCV